MEFTHYKLKDLVKIKNGKDYAQLNSGQVPVYGSGGIMRYVNEYIYDGESILLPRKGSLDNIQYVNGKFWTIDTTYWTIVDSNIAYCRYLYLYLTLLNTTKRNTGSTLPSMTFDTYYTLDVYLPNYETQVKTADAIFDIINKIENNNNINSELESLAKTIYDYWFLQFDFPNEEGKPYKSSGGAMEYNEELKMDIPKGWEVATVTDIADWISNSQPPKNNFIYTQKDGYIRFIQNRDYDSNEYKTYIPMSKTLNIVNRYDILVDKYGDAGSTRYGIEGTYNVALAKIESHNTNMREYLRSFLSSKGIYTYLHNACMASTRASLDESVLSYVYIPIPPSNLLEKYEGMIHLFREQILTLKDENDELSSLRDYLLPLLMNGQVGFKDE